MFLLTHDEDIDLEGAGVSQFAEELIRCRKKRQGTTGRSGF
jgi:hypothetical protein